MASGINIRRSNRRAVSILAVFLSCVLSGTGVWAQGVKEPNVAGAFYPADPEELSAMVDGYMGAAAVAPAQGTPLVLISPHAGYIYSGPVAAFGYKALAGRAFETVVILAASHRFPYEGASVYREGYFRTPLGDLKIDSGLADALIADPSGLAFSEPRVFEEEHSLEVQLPFLQRSLLPGFKVVPVLLGDMTYEDCEKLAQGLGRAIGSKNVLVVASTDLAHFKDYNETLALDRRSVEFMKNNDPRGLWEAVADTGWNVCGVRPVVMGLLYGRVRKADRVDVLRYANSGDTAGDKSRVVGYVSILVSRSDGAAEPSSEQTEVDMFTKEERKRLLEIARASMEAHVKGETARFDEKSPALNVKRGAFVTLHKAGELRGCIGSFTSEEPIYQTVAEMAVSSSSRDPRFPAVEAGELKGIEVEISVLSEPKLIDDWRKIRLGVDGVIVRRGFSSGVFLPQVATETGWDLETFLGSLCSHKAGLPSSCYKEPGTQIYTFQAEVFSEKEF